MPPDARSTPARPSPSRIGDSALAERLRRELKGEVLFDAFSRGRYSTDASIYQIEPIGVVAPRDEQDVQIALQIAADEGIPVLPRGGGTSQCGQTVGEALVMDCSRHLNNLVAFDAKARTATVQPGLVLDQLNKRLKPHGLFFPVDVSTSAQATLGGMAGNNSCGTRSLRYGNMVHNVRAIDAVLADGSAIHFDEVDPERNDLSARHQDLLRRMRALHQREADEIAARIPKVQRKVGGYNIERLGGKRSISPSFWSARKVRWDSSSASKSTFSRCPGTRYWASAIFRPSVRPWNRLSASWHCVRPRWNWQTAP
jgi:hypothetical protein